MSGYVHCACRDCFDVTVGALGELCADCVEAGCDAFYTECQRPDAYGCDDDDGCPDTERAE